MILLQTFYFIILLLMWWCFQGYFLYLYFFVGKRKEAVSGGGGTDGSFSFSVVVLSCNERDYIMRKIENLIKLDYPSFSVFFIDASTDGTDRIIAEKIQGRGNFKLVRAKDKGRSFQINEILKYVDGDYILVTDVDAQLTSDALTIIAGEFRHGAVGVVGGYVKPVTSYSLDMIFWRSHNALKFFETIHGYSPITSGTCYAFRRGVVESIPEDVWADDVYVPLLAHFKGFGCVYSPFVAVEELLGPQSLKSFFYSKVRKSQDIIKEFLRFLCFIPRMRHNWAVIYLTKLIQVVFSPLLLIAIFLLLPYGNSTVFFTIMMFFLCAILLQGFILRKVTLDRSTLLETILVFVMSEVIIFVALMRHLLSRHRNQ